MFRAQGRKVTAQRQCIFRVLQGDVTHPTAESVYAVARAEMETISLKTVYQTLNELAAMGEIAALDLGTGTTRFDPNVERRASPSRVPLAAARCATCTPTSPTSACRPAPTRASRWARPRSCSAGRCRDCRRPLRRGLVPRQTIDLDNTTSPKPTPTDEGEREHTVPALKGSKTESNLKEAFAGESQANRRYLYFAQKADIEGYPDVAALFRSVAEGETGHAFGHFDFLREIGDPVTGVPVGTTADNLKSGHRGRDLRVHRDVPGLRPTARDEGFEDSRRMARDAGPGREEPRRPLHRRPQVASPDDGCVHRRGSIRAGPTSDRSAPPGAVRSCIARSSSTTSRISATYERGRDELPPPDHRAQATPSGGGGALRDARVREPRDHSLPGPGDGPGRAHGLRRAGPGRARHLQRPLPRRPASCRPRCSSS